jgi:hypothetical protein
MSNQNNDIIPAAFICPITLNIMEDPVNDDDGNCYDKAAIMESIRVNGYISPLTRNPITKLISNRPLKELIEIFKNSKSIPFVQPIEVKPISDHNPINIILVIDVSDSMSKICDPPNATEKSNLSRLDLAKHTAKTVIKTLSNNDYVSIISFNNNAMLNKEFIHVNKFTETVLEETVDKLYAAGGTNIWAALKMAIDTAATLPNQKVNILMLTDGESNNDPPRGIIPTLVDYLHTKDINITLNTYGFGNNINSSLLYEISGLKNGLFGYIADGSMMGTVLINSISYLMDNNQKEMTPLESEVINKFVELIDNKKLSEFAEFLSDKLSTEFLNDLHSDCAYSENVVLGQIEKALRPAYYNSWGKHYILSVLSAYKNKFCLNFKDKGVQHFKTPGFIKYQKIVEDIFVKLTPPTPSNPHYSAPNPQQFSQTYYNASSTVCILEGTLVKVFENDCVQYTPVEQLRKGTCIIVGNKSAFIKCVIKTKHNGPICVKEINDGNNKNLIGITSYHPILVNDIWSFPVETNLFQEVEMNNVYVYNFFLEGGEDLHEIELFGGIIASTLNHNKVGPVIGHEYFGTNRVEEDFKKHNGWENGYIQIESIVAIRDNLTNKVIGLTF